MTIKIAVNNRSSLRRITGVERYTSAVTSRLGDRIALKSPENNVAGFRGHYWEQFVLPGTLEKDQILWSPANTGPLSVINQIVTIHDISFIDYPQGFSFLFRLWYRILIPKLIRNAIKIITDSAYMKQRLMDVFSLDSEVIATIPCGVDQQQFYVPEKKIIQSVLNNYGITGRYLFALGSLNPRKNLPRLLKAWQDCSHKDDDIKLVIAGGESPIFPKIDLRKMPENIFHLGYVEDADLAALYSGATAFIYPSLYEGFGLPILEAMACKVPVITSSIGATLEIAKDAALLIDPYSVEGISHAIQTILTDSILRNKLSNEGYLRSINYSWDNTANSIWTVMSEFA